MSRAGGDPPVVAPGRTGRPGLVLFAACLAVFSALGLGRFGYSTVLPAMQDDLSLSNTQAGALASWNLGAYVCVAVVAGVIAAKVGSRRLIVGGLIVAGLSMAATGLAAGAGSAAAARALTGVGGGMVNVPTVALATAWFGARARGLAAGVVVSGSSVALVVTGILVPRLLAAHGGDGWRLCWFLFAAAALISAIVGVFLLRQAPRAQVSGSAPEGKLVDVLRSGFAWRLGVFYLFYGFSYVIYITFFFRRISGDLGFTTAHAGTLFMALGWASLSCGVLWGAVSDRLGRGPTLAITSALQAGSFALFALVGSTPLLLASALIFGITAWSAPGIVGAACGDAFCPSLTAAGLGFVTLFLGIGQALGPVIGGWLADGSGSFVSAYLLAAAVAALAAAAGWLVPRDGRGGRPETH